MSNRMIVIGADPEDFTFPLDRFRESLDSWQPHARLSGSNSGDDLTDATISIDRPDQPGFQIVHFRDGRMISSDGTEEQAAEVAAWAAGTFTRSGPGELWMTDQGYSGHVVLRPGMTVAEIIGGWQKH
jgi:hypothetical protein